jgi:branched-chain amino acid aminotransferase
VLGAGTAVALVPIRSITRRRTAGLLPASPPLRIDADSETVRYVPDEHHSGGPVYLKLLEQLKAIQLGKVPDEFGWRFEMRPEDQEIG